MTIPVSLTVGPLVAASANNIVTSVTPTSGTALTLNGTLVSGGVAIMDKPRRVLLTFGNEASARTLVVTGTNASGNPIQETLTVASGAGGTIATTQDFATVTRLLPLGGGWTAAATVGTNSVGSSPVQIWDAYIAPGEGSWQVIVTGTVNWSIDMSASLPNSNSNHMGGVLGNYPAPLVWSNPVTGLMAQTGSAFGSVVDFPITAWRATINSGSGSILVNFVQAGLPAR